MPYIAGFGSRQSMLLLQFSLTDAKRLGLAGFKFYVAAEGITGAITGCPLCKTECRLNNDYILKRRSLFEIFDKSWLFD